MSLTLTPPSSSLATTETITATPTGTITAPPLSSPSSSLTMTETITAPPSLSLSPSSSLTTTATITASPLSSP
ncbi:MAG: peptidoglycan-binding protein, partial [Alphaproteobacteria bacterium]|nr:peptidoglycan-binding protein [Alphaproteobacteria bacterium]MDA7983404.1 peptidoglycan-binding protein [Alphaproteobacteria bacterium]